MSEPIKTAGVPPPVMADLNNPDIKNMAAHIGGNKQLILRSAP